MPTMKEHFAALKAASDAGDHEAVYYIRAQVLAEQQAADRAEYNPTTGESAVSLGLAGVGRGMMNIARNVGNIAGVVSDESMADASALDAPLMDTTAGKVGNFIGETAAVTPLTMGVGGLAGRTAMLGKTATNPIGRGVIEGATYGAITGGPDNRMGGAVMGGAGGSLLPGAAAGYRALRSGVSPSRSAQVLMRDGVSLTPGQMNPGGVLNQAEEALTPVWGVGKAIQGARDKGYKEFQQSVVNKAAPPGMRISAKDDINDMVADAYRAYGTAYDVAKGFPVSAKIVKTAGGDVPLSQAFKNVASFRGTRAKDDERKAVAGFLQNELTALRGRSLKSDDLLKIRSNIRDEIRALAPDSGEYKILKNAESQVTQALESQLPANAIKSLKATDAQYGKFKILESAVAKAKDQTGSFSPSQFSLAVKEATQTGEYARGGGRMRDSAKAGYDVFEKKQPMTGRQAITAAPLIAAGYAYPALGVPAAIGTAAMYGTNAGRQFAAGQLPAQLAARSAERQVRRAVPKAAREVGSGYARNALLGYFDN